MVARGDSTPRNSTPSRGEAILSPTRASPLSPDLCHRLFVAKLFIRLLRSNTIRIGIPSSLGNVLHLPKRPGVGGTTMTLEHHPGCDSREFKVRCEHESVGSGGRRASQIVPEVCPRHRLVGIRKHRRI